MKILIVTPYITSSAHESFMRNKTGFGMMVYDIARSIGEKCSVDLFAVNSMAPKLSLDSFTTISRSWKTFFSKLSVRNLDDSIKFLKKYKLPFKEKLRVIYQFLAISQVERILHNYDLVHIHGCSPITSAAIRACKRKNIPFVVTLHGLVSFEKSVRLNESLKQYEKDFLIEADLKDYNVTFISTGIKNRAEEYISSKSATK